MYLCMHSTSIRHRLQSTSNKTCIDDLSRLGPTVGSLLPKCKVGPPQTISSGPNDANNMFAYMYSAQIC